MKSGRNLRSNSVSSDTNKENTMPGPNEDGKKLDLILAEIKAVRADQISIQASLTSAHSKIDAVSALLTKQGEDLRLCETDIKALQEENTTLKQHLRSLSVRLNECLQYQRVNALEIHGITEGPNENIMQLLSSVGAALRFPFKSEMVDAAHRLSWPKSGPHAIIVKFVRRCDAQELYRLSRVKRGFPVAELGLQGSSKVYVNYSLTPETRSLHAEARSFKIDNNYRYLWIKSGKIHLREKTGSSVIVINDFQDLHQLIAVSKRNRESRNTEGSGDAAENTAVTTLDESSTENK